MDRAPLTELPPRVLESKRLRLRAIESNDAQLIFDLYANDPVASKYMSFKCTGRLEDTEAFVEKAAPYFKGEDSTCHHYVWVIELKNSGEPIGSTGLGPNNGFTLGGGYILNPKWWGQGYATEAWKCLVDWAKTQRGVYRIEAVHDLDNPASGKVMEKAGMKFEGILRRHSLSPNVSDEPRDAAMYAWARD